MKEKCRWLVILLAVVTSVLSSCLAPAAVSAEKEELSSGASMADNPSIIEQAEFPVMVTDAAGREVCIERKPERLVSGYYITTSMLIALGQEEKLVGIEAKADTRPLYGMAAPKLLDLPNVGTAKVFDLEGCAALRPDLVILPLKLKESINALEELGIPVLTVNPEDLPRLKETIALLGTATGTAQRADSLLKCCDEMQTFLVETIPQSERPSVYLAGNSSYLSTAGSEMYQNTMLELGGGQNVAAELEDPYWAEVSYEQLLAWNPQIILIASGAGYNKEDLISDPNLTSLKAVQDGRVYTMPSSLEAWDSPVPGALLGSLWTASVLHSSFYDSEAFQSDVADFYRTFYDLEIDQAILAR
ncbi:ABC transporter substrate-binding protein [Yanshouia hominis]|nr:ABC transporter substrate-binding protein [Yanshouia hominis]